jgi:hypothetical protein
MTDPIFFILRSTPRQLRLHAASEFNFQDGTFKPVNNRHPQTEEIRHVMDALTVAARSVHPSRVTPDALLTGAQRYLMPDVFERLRVIPGNANLPARIVLRGAA